MTLTLETNLNRITMNHHAKYLGQGLLSSQRYCTHTHPHTHTHTHQTGCSARTTEVVDKNNKKNKNEND